MNVLAGNVLILLFSVVIAVVVIAMVGVLLSEVVFLGRDFREESRIKQVTTTAQSAPRTLHDTGPLRMRDGMIDPFQDRDTVERLIDYFKENNPEEQ